MTQPKKRTGIIAAITIALVVGLTGLSFAYTGHGNHGSDHRGGGYSHNGGCW